ncbi:MAG: S8 family serine peptidase [Caulobacteraceae bacterium]
MIALRAACCLAAMALSAPVAAQPAVPKKVVRTADDLPRYNYPVAGTATALLTADDATFGAFAAKVGADVDRTLADYDIEDHATLRDLLGVRLEVQMLAGQDAAALKTLNEIRAIEDKPDARLLSGVNAEAMLKAHAATGAWSGDAYAQAYGSAYAAALAPLPWAVVANRIKEAKSSAQILTDSLVLGRAQADIEPALAKSHQLSNELAWDLVGLRFAHQFRVPVKATTYAVLAKEVADKDVAKPDIWAAREVTLTDADKLTPVNVAIWDSGVDLALFPGRVYTDPHPAPQFDPHGLAFDLQSRPTHGNLFPLTPEQAAEYPGTREDLKGLSDLQLSIDSPEAEALRRKITALAPDQVPSFLERLSLFGNYIHGTHVAGITARGDPAIRLAAARLTFDWKNVPDLPTEELARRSAASYQVYVDWFKSHGVRVVNMSWGGTPADYETALEKNGVGKDAAERKAMARKLFDIDSGGLLAALKSAPDILFVCAAGNADSNSGFDEATPAAFKLPNLLVVAAVDQAGDEASFTSYGDTVLVDANGYQVLSYTPGGVELRLSGTSMASPNTANLAAKLLALDPKLTPEQVIKLIVAGASPSEDGRRHNINPKKSVELLKAEG